MSIDTQPGFIASLWRSKKSRKHDELQGTLSQGDKVLDSIRGRFAPLRGIGAQ